jgi:hypothetical protein
MKSIRLILIVSIVAAGSLHSYHPVLAQGPRIPEDQRKLVTGNPPRASARTFLSLKTQAATLGDAARILDQTLRQAGYGEQAWYLVSLDQTEVNGFAVITRLERIRPDGSPIQENRFSQDFERPRPTSLLNLLRGALVAAPKGRHRVFAFYVTIRAVPQRTTDTNERLKLEATDSLFVTGARTPDSFQILNTIPTHSPNVFRSVIVAYVYEFERSSGNQPAEFVQNSSQSAEQHLRAAGLRGAFF